MISLKHIGQQSRNATSLIRKGCDLYLTVILLLALSHYSLTGWLNWWFNLPNTLRELNPSNNHWEFLEVDAATVETRDDLALVDILITAMWEALSQRMKLSHTLILTSRQWEFKCIILRCFWVVCYKAIGNEYKWLLKEDQYSCELS